jgi:hypothetical protein
VGAASLRTLAADLNVQGISTVRGQGVCRPQRASASCRAYERVRKNYVRARRTRKNAPLYFFPVTLPDRPKSKGSCASKLIQFPGRIVGNFKHRSPTSLVPVFACARNQRPAVGGRAEDICSCWVVSRFVKVCVRRPRCAPRHHHGAAIRKPSQKRTSQGH